MDKGWIQYRNRMDTGWIQNGYRMDTGWMNTLLTMLSFVISTNYWRPIPRMHCSKVKSVSSTMTNGSTLSRSGGRSRGSRLRISNIKRCEIKTNTTDIRATWTKFVSTFWHLGRGCTTQDQIRIVASGCFSTA